jgi:hypothetical protein
MFIKCNIVKKISNFFNFIIWNIVFFSLFQFVSSDASFVSKDYKSKRDLYDAILNTIFPVFFVVLLNVSGKPGSIKNIILPLLDDLLYNTIAWVIPLIVSFSYDRLMPLKIFSIVNMGLHVICAVFAIINWTRIVDYEKYSVFDGIVLFLIFFPAIVTPTFWIIVIYKNGDAIPIIILITLFGLCLVSFILVIILSALSHYFERIKEKMNVLKIINVLCIICFYFPNIIQTLWITLRWPINFYFVKACIFILVLSLTRNMSYFTDKVPENFLATSTSATQCSIRSFTKNSILEICKTHISMEEMHEMQETMQTTIDEMRKTMNEMKISMGEMKKNQPKDENV